MVQSELFAHDNTADHGPVSLPINEEPANQAHYGEIAERTHQRMVQIVDEMWNEGPCIRMLIGPTGVGKTTSLARIIADSINRCRGIRYAIAMPTCQMAEEIYQTILQHVDHMHAQKVAVWTSEHEAGVYGRIESRDKRLHDADVVVGSHAFLAKSVDPSRWIGDRDFLFIDETPSSDVGLFNSGDVARAYEWAVDNDLDEFGSFKALHDFSVQLIEDRPTQDFSKTVGDADKLRKTLRHVSENYNGFVPESCRVILSYMQAAADRRSFVAWSADNRSEELIKEQGAERFIEWVFYELPHRHFERTAFISATADLDGFTADESTVRRLADPPDYSRLTIREVAWPKNLPTNIKRIDASKHGKVIDILLHKLFGACGDDMRPVLIVAPLSLKNIIYEKIVASPSTYGREVMLTHYGADLGTNAFMKCQTVIFLANHYLPKAVIGARQLQAKHQRVSDHSLKGINNRSSQRDGKVRSMESAFRQYLARGCVRLLDEDGIAKRMDAIVCWPQFTSEIAERSFPGCTIVRSEEKKALIKKRSDGRKDSFVGKLVNALDQFDGDTATASDLGINQSQLSRNRKKLIDCTEIELIGWKFVPGKRGHHPHSFIRN